MSTRVVDQVDSWDEQSFSGGYRALHDLADREFSGVVRAGGAELYMTRGVAVGIRLGDIEDFESTGSIYDAPADALPLLAVMQDENEEVKAKYYSEKTAISKVDKTLSDGGFTGFIELSENVLSGDYYLVYQAGKSMAVAYVGESSRLLSGDEAFETADDEVGIYRVHPAEIEPVEIPDPEPESRTEGAAIADTDSPGGDQEDASEGSPTAETGTQPDSKSEATGQETPEASEQSQSGVSEQAESPAGEAGQDDPASGTTTDPATGASGRTQSQTGSNTHGDGQSDGSQSGTEAETVPKEQSGSTEPTSSPDRQTDKRQSVGGRSQGERNHQEQSPPQNQQGRSTGEQTGQQRGHERRQSSQPRADPDDGRNRKRTRTPGGTERGQPQAPANSHSAQSGGDLETKSIPALDPSKTDIPDQQGGAGNDIPTPSRSPPQSGNGQPDGVSRGASNSQRANHRGDSQPTDQARSEPPKHATDTVQDGANAEAGPARGRSENPQPEESTPDAAASHQQSGPTAEPAGQQGEPDQQDGSTEGDQSVNSDRLETVETELEEKETEIDRLEDELDSATTEREDLRDQVDTLESEREELQAEVDRLQTELERLEEELGAATDKERRITSGEALAGTDIFVRYRSKGKATLEKAHGASTRKDEVNENLRLEKHTQFDSNAVAVGGQSYDEFLETTLEFQFVRWAVRELLFEIRDTGHEKSLGDLYNVLPHIDRAELSGVVDVTYTEDGQETQSQESFDVVLRDRMGHPLLVANLNDSREATTEDMMERLITAAERVGQSSDEFAGAFLVTESFFDPGALEVASAATQGGLLSRDKRKSFVNLSRKTGYHLCLVEARNENFHLAVPEL